MKLIFLSRSFCLGLGLNKQTNNHTNKLLTCRRSWAGRWPPFTSIPNYGLGLLITIRLHNRLPILRFIKVSIGLENVICNNLDNSSLSTNQPTDRPIDRLTSPSYTMSVPPLLLSMVQIDSQSFFPSSLPSAQQQTLYDPFRFDYEFTILHVHNALQGIILHWP